MATYYVQPNGSDANSGTGPSNGSAWLTVQKALGASGANSGDTVYIAPGTYREAITFAGSWTSTVNIIGDKRATQFNNISPGIVRITGLSSDSLNVSTSLGGFSTNGKSYVSFDSIWFEHSVTIGSSSSYVQFTRCLISPSFQPTPGQSGALITLNTAGQNFNLFDKCHISGSVSVTGAGSSTGNRFNACIIECNSIGGNGGINFTTSSTPMIYFTNCTITGASAQQIFRGYDGATGSSAAFIYNCLIVPSYCQPTIGTNSNNFFIEDYNAGYITRGGGVSTGANTKQLYHRPYIQAPVNVSAIDAAIMPYTPIASDSLVGAGSSAYIYGTDYYGNAWANPPSIGAMEIKSFSTIGSYLPTDKTFTNLTLAPDSTSQTIYLSVGSTGIGFSATGISCYYTRDGANPVGIGLTAQTATGAWVSGGFAEVDSTNQPGIYRLDVPNAALSSGVNKVIVSFRGAAGVNGAYCNISLNYTRLPDVESRTFVSGNTSLVEYINITQSNSGAPLTGLTYQSSGLTAYYIRPGGTPTSITLNSQTATGSFTSGGFVAVDNTNMPGLYRIDIPNAVFATGVTKATVYLRGAGNMNPIRIEYK
jgi:hypothetical protein